MENPTINIQFTITDSGPTDGSEPRIVTLLDRLADDESLTGYLGELRDLILHVGYR